MGEKPIEQRIRELAERAAIEGHRGSIEDVWFEDFKAQFERNMKENRRREEAEKEPVYFRKKEQINGDVYEYVESKDIRVEGEHTVPLTRVHKKQGMPMPVSEHIIDDGEEYLVDGKGEVLIKSLKDKAVDEAKRIAKERGYGAVFIHGDNNSWKMIGLKQTRWSAVFSIDKYNVRYSFSTLAEFYRKKQKELNKAHWNAYHESGKALLNHKRDGEPLEEKVIRINAAIENYKTAAALNPESFWSYHDIGTCFLELENPSEAEGYYKKAIEVNGGNESGAGICWLYHDLGVSLLRQGRYEEAIKLYQKANEIELHAWTFNDMGNCYYVLGRYGEAEENFRRAISMETNNAHFHGCLAKALEKQGKQEEAEEMWAKEKELERNEQNN